MKTLNYIVCSTIIFIEIVLLMSGETTATIAGLIWLAINLKFSALNIGRKMWEKYWKTNQEINKYFGID